MGEEEEQEEEVCGEGGEGARQVPAKRTSTMHTRGAASGEEEEEEALTSFSTLWQTLASWHTTSEGRQSRKKLNTGG